MSILKNIGKSIENSGFGANSNAEGGRLVNKDGIINVRKIGTPFLQRISLYHLLLRLPRFQFLLLVFGFYTAINLLFATIYMVIGIEHLAGDIAQNNFSEQFQKAFFFSSQTLTTVGYGHISPSGLLANTVASLESFIGIMSFAMVTGLFFARFARPKAFMIFSKNIIIAPFKDATALMFRVATSKNNHLTDAEAQVTSAFHVMEDGKRVTRFFQLPLEISKINSLALTWTLVHIIDEQSPFWGLKEADLDAIEIEVMPSIRAFDDHYANTVQQRTSYHSAEFIFGAKFVPAFERSADGSHTILALNRLNDYELVGI